MTATVIHALLGHAESDPERAFLTFADTGERWSFGDTLVHAGRAAAALAEHARAGDRVVIVGGNDPSTAAVLLGAMGSGLIPAVVHPPLRAATGAAINVLGRVVARAEPALMVAPKSVCPAGVRSATAESLVSQTESVALEPPAHDSICYLQFSSGTTGPQKAVAIRAGAQAENCRVSMAEIRSHGDERWLTWLPYYHDMGLMTGLLIPAVVGQQCVVLRPERFVTRPLGWLEAIHEHRPELTIAPNFAYALVARRATAERIRDLDLSSLRVAFNGAEMVHAETVRRFEERLAPAGLRANTVYPVYGLAETTLASAFWRVQTPIRVDHVRRDALGQARAEPSAAGEPGTVELVSVGRAVAGHGVRVMRAESEAGEREVGELEVTGPSKMAGYWGEPERTREVTHGDWVRTGDLAYVADGDLFICGRSKNVVVRFGESFHVEHLEWAAAQAPGVKPGRLYVHGVEDAALGTERIWLVMETDATGTAADDLARSVRDFVVATAGFKFDGVTCVAPGTIQKTSSGKVIRSGTGT